MSAADTTATTVEGNPGEQPGDETVGRELTRLRLDIAYDGGNFWGWSRQPGLRTIQGEIESALAIIFRRFLPLSSLVVAGRTDAGVHAIGQVAHLDVTPAQLASLERPRRGTMAGRVFDGPASLGRRINGIIGHDSEIFVSRSAIAPPGFDARFSALWRRYEYRVADADAPRNPLERHRTLWYPASLDGDRMDAAAVSLLGLHDWAAYCKPRDGATTIRNLEEFSWKRQDDGILVARVQADAFCHSMVRSLVGACVAVGEGKLQPNQLMAIRDNRMRTSDFKVLPAKGLTLIEVGYPPDGDLAARTELTRAHRSTCDGLTEPLEVD